MTLLDCIVNKEGFNEIAAKNLDFGIIFSGEIFTLVIISTLVLGVAAGIYPALLMASFQPINALKKNVGTNKKSPLFRKVLVIAQFAISIFILINTFIVFEQLEFLKNKKLGFNKEEVLVITRTGVLGKQSKPFKNELLKYIKTARKKFKKDKTIHDATIYGHQDGGWGITYMVGPGTDQNIKKLKYYCHTKKSQMNANRWYAVYDTGSKKYKIHHVMHFL